MWECVGGSVLKGEDSLTGAIREVREEVGLVLSPEYAKRVCSVVREDVDGILFRDILDVWRFEYDGPVTLEQATTQEVAQTAWMTKEQIQKLLNNGKLVHTLSYFLTQRGYKHGHKNLLERCSTTGCRCHARILPPQCLGKLAQHQ